MSSPETPQYIIRLAILSIPMAALTIGVARWKFGDWPKFGYAFLSAMIGTFFTIKVHPFLLGMLSYNISNAGAGAAAVTTYSIMTILILHFIVMMLVNRLLVTSPQETSLTYVGSFQVTLAQSVVVVAVAVALLAG